MPRRAPAARKRPRRRPATTSWASRSTSSKRSTDGEPQISPPDERWSPGFVTVEGHRLECYRLGAPPPAPTLVFLHEGLGSARQWRDFPDALCRRTRCGGLVYSRWGYGQSDAIDRPRPERFMHDEALNVLPRVLE